MLLAHLSPRPPMLLASAAERGEDEDSGATPIAIPYPAARACLSARYSFCRPVRQSD